MSRASSVTSGGSSDATRPSSITSSLAPKGRKGNDLSHLTIDKLKFASLGLHGRKQELEILKNTLDKLLTGESSEQERQLFLISGYSGTGKTTLANNALQNSTKLLGGLFVRGKFDLNLRKTPYSGIASACTEICDSILQLKTKNPSLFERLCSQIKTEVGSELALLVQVIPVLAKVVEYSDVDPNDSPTITSKPPNQRGDNNNKSGMSAGDSKNQFNFAFLRFFRVISQQFPPILFVLDDLQWADGASLDLLDVLLTDQNISKLMIVGIYRSNEINKTHIFYRTIEDLAVKSKGKYFEMTQLEIGNLELEAINLIIQDLLDIDSDSQTFGLAYICHKKTHGNVFFLLQFLRMLKEHQMLQFNYGTISWTWDCQEIESRTSASDNVVDLLKDKMAELSKHMIDVLKLCACLGSKFEVRTLSIVWEMSVDLALEAHDVLMSTLEMLEDDGYFVDNGSQQSYSWGHDKIQEAALTLVPEIERGAFAAKVGGILLSHFDEKDLDSAIFVVVNLLNEGDDKMNDKSRLDLARLNYEASRKAVSFSAFESAAEYAAKGIRLLPGNAWVDHYEFSLKIYTIGAQAEGFIGNTETMERYCKQVRLQENRPIEDKFEVYHIWIDNVMNQGLLDEARDLSFEILQKFKCTFPKNPILVGLELASNIVQIKATMKSRDASKLSTLTDSTRTELMKFLDKLSTILYMAKDDRMPLVIFRNLKWTMRYGYCNYSSPAFATTGIILTGALNDLQGGSRYGEQAVTLMEKSKSQATAARTIFCVYSFVFPWTKPLRSLLNPLLRGYDIGLQTGDAESATWSILMWLTLKYPIGGSLETLEADSLLYFKQMEAMKRGQAVKVIILLRQAFLNLLGRDNVDNPTNFSGDAISGQELERLREDSFVGPGLCAYEGILLTYFGEHTRHADSAIKLGHDNLQKTWVGTPVLMWDSLFKGLSCFAAARETRKRKYAKMGQIFRSKIKTWLAMGNPNVKHYESLLDAEYMALKGKKVAAIQHYESAILLAARCGYQHDAALATERLGEFHLKVSGDKEEAAFQIGESIKYWREWGAIAKVNHLQEKYADLVVVPPLP